MDGPAVKIALRGRDDEVETLWADRTEVEGHFVLDNMPWYAYGVSLGDTVEARPDADGYLEMTRLVRKCGNRTIRVIFALMSTGEWTSESRAALAGLRELGGDIENMNTALVAVTVPPAADLLAIGTFIDAAGFEFEYADPPHEDLFPDDSP